MKQVHSTKNQSKAEIEKERGVFDLARKSVLKPGPVFRLVSYLFAERALFVIFSMHFVCTMVCWAHFALVKWQEQERNVSDGAPNYWWKRIAPPLEFGSMHAILFQMALLPLTMSRFSISALSESIVNRYIPLNRMVRIHIHLGYTMVTIVFLATIFFFVFFGHLCRSGEEAFCDKFTIEIMITGYILLAILLILGGTSYFRHSMPYELFYAIHHLVFLLFGVAVLHTFDNVQRDNERTRSQTFMWFSAPLMYYFCDRAAMHFNNKYSVRLAASSTLEGNNGHKMIILKIRRPVLFNFKPGQYAFLRLSNIDPWWHPFSIASDPSAEYLEFCIQAFEEHTWTGKLWRILDKDGHSERFLNELDISCEVMGPYGTSLAKAQDFSHVLAVGAGTGIVPILSLYKKHIQSLVKRNPKAHYKSIQEHNEFVLQMDTARSFVKGTFYEKTLRTCFRKDKTPDDRAPITQHLDGPGTRSTLNEDMRTALTKYQAEVEAKGISEADKSEMNAIAWSATRSIYGVIPLSMLPVLGLLVIALTISWNTIPIDLYNWMVPLLQVLVVIFQICFAFVAFFVWDANGLFAYIDVVVSIFIMPFVDWFWHKRYDEEGVLRPTDITLFCLLHVYMLVRTWSRTVKPRRSSWHKVDHHAATTTDRLEVVWTARSAPLVSAILPEMNEFWDNLIQLWGEEGANEVCRISIYVTDTDPAQVALLKQQVHWMTLYRNGCLTFGRPDFEAILEDHTLELIATRRNSYSLLAFCGSPDLATELHQIKIANDMLTSITGNRVHQMEFVSESYGGLSSREKEKIEASSFIKLSANFGRGSQLKESAPDPPGSFHKLCVSQGSKVSSNKPAVGSGSTMVESSISSNEEESVGIGCHHRRNTTKYTQGNDSNALVSSSIVEDANTLGHEFGSQIAL